jgi:Protein of unknown function (DUF667)
MFAEFDGLSLQGRYVYVQYNVLKPPSATLHLELQLSTKMPLRITLSTLYKTPKSLGAILRLPLPYTVDGWLCLGIDIDSILQKYGFDTKDRHIRKIQVCYAGCV